MLQYAFYVNGRAAYPADYDREQLRDGLCCLSSGSCTLGAGQLMNGSYAVRDKKGRVWIEDQYQNGYLVERTVYSRGTGNRQGHFQYLDSAWLNTDGTKVIYALFDETNNQLTSRYSWVLENGKWKKGTVTGW